MRPVGRFAGRGWRPFVTAALVLVLLLLAPASVALAGIGQVGPGDRPDASRLGRVGADAWVMYGIQDAQASGSLVYKMTETAPQMTLTASDAAGATVWSLQAGDAWVATGTLPAALVAFFTDPDPNELRDGTLRAYNADGTVRFEKTFSDKFVQPLCDTAKRLVWVEVSARAITRVFVRQGTRTRSVAMPYRQTRAEFPVPVGSSARGNRLAVGVYKRLPSKWRSVVYWVRVSRTGVPRIVAGKAVGWPYLAMSPDGSHAAVLDDRIPYATSRLLWVPFGKFGGSLLPGDALAMSQMDVSSQRFFEQGGYGYASDEVAWSAYSVAVADRSMMYLYQRTWVFDDAESWMWFRHDPDIRYLAGIDRAGALTVINVDSWMTVPVPGAYADAVPLSDGRLVLLGLDGLLTFITNPVAGPY